MKIVVFGAGNYYKENCEELYNLSGVEIIALSDNNSALWGKSIDGITVISPESISRTAYERIVIISIYAREIYEQLISLGVEKNRIIIWERFWAEQSRNNGMLPEPIWETDNEKEAVLILSTNLNYNGGSLSAVYAARALKERGIHVVLAAPEGNEQFVRETVDQGITVVLDRAFPCLFEAEKEWIMKFQIVMVNTLQMMECVSEISKLRPVFWWLHEPSSFYKWVTDRYPDSLNVGRFINTHICAVSRKAQQNFNCIYPNRVKDILPYGIPDMNLTECKGDGKNGRIVFAIIGTVYPLKGQDIFLRAAEQIKEYSRQAEYWIIGKFLEKEKDYVKKIREMAAKNVSVKIFGELTREEMQSVFGEIDVVVCASREDMLPITITEAMMYGKVPVITVNTGTADYIKDGVNGFIVPVSDEDALAEKMQWIIKRFDELENVRIEARKTYEKYFSMDILGENLEKELEKTQRKWCHCHEGENIESSMHLSDI